MAGTFPPDVIAAAQASGRKCGVFPSVILAQWALESAWGRSMSGKNNPFGIKAVAGQSGTVVTTHEQNADGVAHVERAAFANYASVAEAFEAHARLLLSQRYAPVRAAKTPQDAARQLKACGYATDALYPSKLISIMSQSDAYAYDAPPIITPADKPPIKRVVTPTSKPSKVSTGTGAVVAGGVTVITTGTAVASGGTTEWIIIAGVAAAVLAVALFLHLRKA